MSETYISHCQPASGLYVDTCRYLYPPSDVAILELVTLRQADAPTRSTYDVISDLAYRRVNVATTSTVLELRRYVFSFHAPGFVD